VRRIAAYTEPAAQQQTSTDCEGNSSSGVEEAIVSGAQHIVEIHTEAKSHDGGLQQKSRALATFRQVRIRQLKAKREPHEQGNRRGNPSREAGNEQDGK